MEPPLKPQKELAELDALRESERRFRAIYEQAPIGMSLVDIRTGRFVNFNAKFCEITARSPQELLELDFLTLTHPEDRVENLAHLTRLREGRCQSFTFEKRYVRPDASIIWVSATVVPMWTQGAEPDFYMTLVEDISGRKAAEEKRLRQIAFDRLITEIMGRFASCTGLEIDREIQDSLGVLGSFIGAEEAFVSQFARDMASWSVVSCWSAEGVDLKPRYQNVPMGTFPWVDQRIFSGKYVQITDLPDWPHEADVEREFHEQRGIKSVLVLPLRGREAQVHGAVGLRSLTKPVRWSEDDARRLRLYADAVANVIERKRVETALYESRRTLQQILDTIPHRVFWKDRSLHYLGCNVALARDLGLKSPSEVLGKTDFDLFTREAAERYRADDRQVVDSGKPKMGYEEEEPLPNGTSLWMRVSKVPLRDGENQVMGMLGVAEDTLALRQARVALEQAKEAAEAANQAKDQFIAVLSHELRTPLTPVLALVSAMEELGRLPEPADLDTIHRNVELEARLIDDLLDVTRISQGKLTLRPEMLDAHACLKSTVQICESELKAKGQELVLRLDATRHFVWADSARLGQVFWNLLKNSVKFTSEGGRIELQTFNRQDRLVITVADNGIGIEPQVLPRVFNAFEQGERSRRRQFGGLGLGLSIAKALVEMHQGTLSASSAGKNRGAVFTVELAAHAAEPVPQAEPRPRKPSTGTSRRILLVEDHPDTARILARLLGQWGYEIVGAGSVQAALQKMRAEQLDLVISDLGLPDGSGLEIARRLTGVGTPGIALSGYGTDEDIRASLDAGFAEHLIKPVGAQTLRAAVEKLLAQ